jgi:hypothetical protein
MTLRALLLACIAAIAALAAAVPASAATLPDAVMSPNVEYLYGRAGTIIDARGILDSTPPKVIGNWIDELKAQGVDEQSCQHIREIRPGVLLTACQPFAALSINAEDGGSPAHPKVLYTGAAAKFVHSARWPRAGADKFALIGGEQNFTGRCERNNSEFSVYSAEKVLAGQSTQSEGPLAQVPPAEPGRVPGTNGETPPIAPNAAQIAQRTALAKRLQASGWSPGLCQLAANRI